MFKFLNKLWKETRGIILPVVCVYLICQFIICPVQVSGSSMYPTLIGAENGKRAGGDYLLMLRKPISGNYQQGEIVIASIPSYENGKYLIKRVIATEGQIIDIDYDDNNILRVYVDGQVLDEPYINEEMLPVFFDNNPYPMTIPENSYFLLGDNRNNSMDSRNSAIGIVHKEDIIGKAVLVLIPGKNIQNNQRNWDRIGSIDKT